ncbi:hypothetical protein ACVWZ3_006706 [Bradyrhizobium sp. i1.3.6]
MRGLDAVKGCDIGIRQWRRDLQPRVKGAHALLAAGDTQQLLVDGPVPLPVEAVTDEGMVEGPPMQLLGFGQRAVDIEDQRGGAPDQLRGTAWHCGRRFCLHDRHLPPDKRASRALAAE